MTTRTLTLLLTAALLAACSTAPKTVAGRNALVVDAQAAITSMKARDPGLQSFFDSAHAYAVFPNVGKGGFIVGGAYGQGVVYENDVLVGYCDISQGSVGATVGGQAFSEIIFFQTPGKFAEFRAGTFTLAAQASAIVVTAGASVDADYDKGVAVFTMGQGGLMVDASVGGQGFSFLPATIATVTE